MDEVEFLGEGPWELGVGDDEVAVRGDAVGVNS